MWWLQGGSQKQYLPRKSLELLLFASQFFIFINHLSSFVKRVIIITLFMLSSLFFTMHFVVHSLIFIISLSLTSSLTSHYRVHGRSGSREAPPAIPRGRRKQTRRPCTKPRPLCSPLSRTTARLDLIQLCMSVAARSLAALSLPL